jgi:nucleoside-diphosphate-sugar epimerase
MRVLITGASGFIGSRLIRHLLADDQEVVALVRQPDRIPRLEGVRASIELVRADLRDHESIEQAVRGARPDLVIHLAWYPGGAERWSSPGNLDALHDSVNLIHAVGRSGCRRFVGVGTCVEYDVSGGYLSEGSRLRPNTMYGVGKLSLFYALEQLASLYGLDYAWPRIFYVYGSGEDPERLIAYVINQLLDDEPALLTSGRQIRDYLHVDDVAAAIWQVAASPFNGAVNVGSGEPVSVAQVAASIGTIMGKPSLVKLGARPDRPGDPAFICANNARLRQLGWQPRYRLESGLRQTIAWWQNQHKVTS